MTCGARKDKTLYDKTVVGRARSMSRRAKRTAASLLAFGLLLGGTASGIAPANAVAYGGFSTAATATPIKLEIFEPVLPLPTEPQGEFDISYTRVLGGSGPATTARASAFWPGAAIGEGLKTFGEQLGLPAQLTDGGYPVQANAGFPGDTPEQYQEFFPGMIGRVSAGDKRTVAKVAYTSSDVNDGDAGDSKAPSADPLAALKELFGAKPAPSTNPLGTLGLLIDFDGMTSVSSSDYDGTTAVATATSRIGELRLLAGVIKLTGVNVVTKVTSTLDGGASTSQTVDVGGMTVAGQKFAYGPDGFTAVGKVTPIPGIPTSAADLLKTLGVAIEVPKPEITKSGSTAKVVAEAARVTIDTAPLRKNLPKLPLDDLVNGLPDLQQGNILKGLLLSINTIAPKIVLRLGYSEASASTITLADLGGTGPVPAAGTGGGLAPALDDVPPTTDLGGDNTTAAPVAKGMPPLRSLPMILLIGGALLASGVAWYLRQAGLLLFGGANDCSFGLQAGIPDLRKA
ncbi:choice-of-anchor P family protein [Aeromicrobium sp.]|uniref:choice-of-anchor P family protein n=1 Tax=Aeromicrobium sp. TaxID=1871063 RepID=UPI002FC8C6F7